MRNQSSLAHAKHLRSEMTPAETRLWHHLRAGRFDQWRFRRQTVISPYIADFTCRAAMLVVEIDGDTHATQTTYDAHRAKFLETHGWRVIRFTNADVIGNLEGVLQQLQSSFSPSPNLSPEGERALARAKFFGRSKPSSIAANSARPGTNTA